jgi:ankyrin repeat protein
VREGADALRLRFMRNRHSRSALSLCLRLQDGVTLLHRAVVNGHDKVVKMLVREGADINAIDKVGVIFPSCENGIGYCSQQIAYLLTK